MEVVANKLNQKAEKQVSLEYEQGDLHPLLKISNYNKMRPFFMSIVSDSDHWMFISSNGGLSMGRKNSEFAIFPYYTDDKITEFADITGSKTIFQVLKNGEVVIWEPFSDRHPDQFAITRNLYKSVYGNTIRFEEINHDLELTFSYSWSSSNQFGFIKTAELVNNSGAQVEVNVLDGIQNVLPYGVGSDLQRASSNLVDAYKRSELQESSGLGIFALSAIIVDKAEPSEALKANVVWHLGLERPTILLSSLQLDNFRERQSVQGESDVKGEKGAYFLNKKLSLAPNSQTRWKIIANTNQNHSQVIHLIEDIINAQDLEERILKDIEAGTQNLIKLVASSDGIQHTADTLQDCRHFSNVLFNIMRGGIFDENYQIEKHDFLKYLEKANQKLAQNYKDFVSGLGDKFSYYHLKNALQDKEDADLIRLSIEYLPLKFSRRHGDPSRPWNRFSINLRDEKDGSKILDYEGNWRDIFQNWEALAHSFPEFIDGMIFKFLNASTFDGYNPYRVTKDGFDWEVIEPDDPWSYIGYWGDHQIIYLQKFLEIIENFYPGRLQNFLAEEWFVYAAVPYTIKSHSEIVKNPKDTIDFDHEWDTRIREQRALVGADGALWVDSTKEIYHVNLIEKLLATLLAKLSNFIPEGGIWMNTQRPEWNDANNALVGNGVSMVTLYYLRRCLHHINGIIEQSPIDQFKISGELVEFYHSVRSVFEEYHLALESEISDLDRKSMLDKLGESASEYRNFIYKNGFWGKKRSISKAGLLKFLQLSLEFADHSIRNNQRADKLFHAYNLMTYTENGVSIHHLDEMLEGQVAVLSSGYLNATQALEVLDAMKASTLFRPDQYSYILYPNKNLPGFLQKNTVPASAIAASKLAASLLSNGNKDIIEADIHGNHHFNGDFKNATDLELALDNLPEKYQELVENERKLWLDVFEKIFNHKAFTGRSGTFFAFEGLGSIYWHMVSKLLLATQESCIKAIAEKSPENTIGNLLDHYYEIQAGIGVHKSPELYGAFPTDPYSHTPMHRGAQQPGMTGQVKEDLLVALAEKGISVQEGTLTFNPCLLRKTEFTTENKSVFYINLEGETETLHLSDGQLFFSYCQIPIVYQISDTNSIQLIYDDQSAQTVIGLRLSEEVCNSIFKRDNKIKLIKVELKDSQLK